MHRDATGFPLSVKPSHLFDAAEQMDTAEILSMIVDRACLYVPDVPVSEIFKKPKALTRDVKVPKEALSKDVKIPNEELSEVVKDSVVAASSDFVRLKCNRLIVCFKSCSRIANCQLVWLISRYCMFYVLT